MDACVTSKTLYLYGVVVILLQTAGSPLSSFSEALYVSLPHGGTDVIACVWASEPEVGSRTRFGRPFFRARSRSKAQAPTALDDVLLTMRQEAPQRVCVARLSAFAHSSYSEHYESGRGGREPSRGSQEGWHFAGAPRSSRRDRERERDQDANTSRGESQENLSSRHFRRDNDTERDFGSSSRGTSRDNNASSSRRRDEEGRSRRGGEGAGGNREERGGRFRDHSRHHYERDWRDDKDRGRDRDREGYSRARLDRARGTSKDSRDRR